MVRIAIVLTCLAFWAGSASAQWRSSNEMRQHPGNSAQQHGARNVGAGLAIGIGIANQLMQPQGRAAQRSDAKKARSRPKPKDSATQESKNKQAKQNKKPASAKQPENAFVFTPPVFPAVTQVNDCNDCKELWESILEYQRIITEDTKKLAQRRAEAAAKKAELARLEASARAAKNAIRKDYFEEMISITKASIESLEQQNVELQNLIDEEWKILKDRIAQYEACVDRLCRKEVAVVPVPDPPPPLAPPPAPPPPASVPERPSIPVSVPEERRVRMPPPDQAIKICGPDITEQVLKVLAKIRSDYQNNPDMQTEACRNLLDPGTAESAWDIHQLSPATAPAPGANYDPSTDEFVDPPIPGSKLPPLRSKPWFTKSSHLCAIPRPVCGASVQFMGTCQHAQVVNYVQWGFMTKLCGGLYPVLGSMAHAAYNIRRYGLNAPSGSQDNMVAAGEEIAEAWEGYWQRIEGTQSASRGELFDSDLSRIRKRVQEREQESPNSFQDCQLKCTAKPHESEFTYFWSGLLHSLGTRTSPSSVVDGILNR